MKNILKEKLIEVSHKNDPFETRKLYKIYNDGGHYVARYVKQGIKKSKNKSITEEERFFDIIYLNALKENKEGNDLSSFLVQKIKKEYPTKENVESFVEERLLKKKKLYYNRIKRFKRKAHLNKWNYWVTITYDNKKCTQEEFSKKLRKCLSNLHTRYGYKYMGVFELAPETNRLHFHALMYIPDGYMVGTIKEKKDYSTAQHKMQSAFINTFFEKRFGRNDFQILKEKELNSGLLDYIIKYLSKTGEKIIYSRGILSEFMKKLDDVDIAIQIVDFCYKFILFDDVIDYEKDVLHLKKYQDFMFKEIPIEQYPKIKI